MICSWSNGCYASADLSGRQITEHEMQEQERDLAHTLGIPNSTGDFEMQMKYMGNPTCRCLQASQRLEHQSLPRPGRANKSSEGSGFAGPGFFPYAPENPEQSHWQLLDTWSFCLHTAFENVVHCGGSCHMCLFICFCSHLLLAARSLQAWQIFRSPLALT